MIWHFSDDSVCCSADGLKPIPENIGESHPAFPAAGQHGKVAHKGMTRVLTTQAAPNKGELVLKVAETAHKGECKKVSTGPKQHYSVRFHALVL